MRIRTRRAHVPSRSPVGELPRGEPSSSRSWGSGLPRTDPMSPSGQPGVADVPERPAKVGAPEGAFHARRCGLPLVAVTGRWRIRRHTGDPRQRVADPIPKVARCLTRRRPKPVERSAVGLAPPDRSRKASDPNRPGEPGRRDAARTRCCRHDRSDDAPPRTATVPRCSLPWAVVHVLGDAARSEDRAANTSAQANHTRLGCVLRRTHGVAGAWQPAAHDSEDSSVLAERTSRMGDTSVARDVLPKQRIVRRGS